jgi:S-adenosylmethionine-diacylglycerol 3-amino-3-carboxypropyl transferase
MFTQSWEDPRCDLQALGPLHGKTVLAITSGGDNTLGFLLEDPKQVTAVDINPAQQHLLALKMAAFRTLDHPQFLELLGVSPAHGSAAQLYPKVRTALGDEAALYWDAHLPTLRTPLIVSGAFERYFALLRRILHVVHGRARLEKLFTLTHAEQPSFYDREWNSWRWRQFINVCCSKWMLGSRLDPSWFEHADVASFGEHFTRLARHAVAELPSRSNYFLAQIFLGRYVDGTEMPAYLQQHNFETIRDRLDRISMATGDVVNVLAGASARSVDLFALSNVFEYAGSELFERGKDQIARVARPSARLALRNLLARRSFAGDARFQVDVNLGRQLQAEDRGFIYSAFETATVGSATEGASS